MKASVNTKWPEESFEETDSDIDDRLARTEL